MYSAGYTRRATLLEGKVTEVFEAPLQISSLDSKTYTQHVLLNQILVHNYGCSALMEGRSQ